MSKLLVLLLVLLGFTVTGCNTFRGAGRDVQAVGQSVEEAADEVQDDLND